MTSLRAQLAAVPRWRVGLYAFIAGAGLAVAVAAVAVGQGLVSPPVEREVEVRTVVRERVVQRMAKRANVVTTSTPGLLRVPDGGWLLGYTTRTVDLSTEESSTDATRANDTAQKSTERPALPSWRVGVQVGGQFAGTPALSIPGAPRLVVGVEASYRLPLDRLGLPPRYGIWAGVWGGTYGAAGASVSGEF